MYKTAFISCVVDTVMIENVDLLVRKYVCDYTPMCCALSKDKKVIVISCANYLILINVVNGK